jgi:hypothetical protein
LLFGWVQDESGQSESVLVSENFTGMAEKRSCIFGMSAIPGGQIQ